MWASLKRRCLRKKNLALTLLLGMVPERKEPWKTFFFGAFWNIFSCIHTLKACKGGWGFVCCVACLHGDQRSGGTGAFLLGGDLFMMFGLSSLFLRFKCLAQNCLVLEVVFIFTGLYGHCLMYMALYNEWAVYPLICVNMSGAIQLEETEIIFWPAGVCISKEARWLAGSVFWLLLKICWGIMQKLKGQEVISEPKST